MRRTLVPAWLEAAIDQEVDLYPDGRLKQLVDDSLEQGGGAPLAIKYVPAKWARTYARSGGTLRISNHPGFTWGSGTYATPLAFPISSAIFGRVGIVARFQPAGWRVFDATLPRKQELYMQWVYSQPRRRQLLLTTHSQVANQFLRNLFRTTFQIDCVLFHPDQRNRFYTDHTDVWITVSDWNQGNWSEPAVAHASRMRKWLSSWRRSSSPAPMTSGGRRSSVREPLERPMHLRLPRSALPTPATTSSIFTHEQPPRLGRRLHRSGCQSAVRRRGQ